MSSELGPTVPGPPKLVSSKLTPLLKVISVLVKETLVVDAPPETVPLTTAVKLSWPPGAGLIRVTSSVNAVGPTVPDGAPTQVNWPN